jgi:hypothetical protein
MYYLPLLLAEVLLRLGRPAGVNTLPSTPKRQHASCQNTSSKHDNPLHDATVGCTPAAFKRQRSKRDTDYKAVLCC